MTELLFHTPWGLPALLIGAGVILFWTGNQRQGTRVRLAGMLLILAAAVLCTVSYLVDTDLEKAVKNSKALAYAVEQRDWVKMKAIMDPSCALTVMGSVQIYDNRDQILAGAKRAVEQYGVRNIR